MGFFFFFWGGGLGGGGGGVGDGRSVFRHFSSSCQQPLRYCRTSCVKTRLACSTTIFISLVMELYQNNIFSFSTLLLSIFSAGIGNGTSGKTGAKTQLDLNIEKFTERDREG